MRTVAIEHLLEIKRTKEIAAKVAHLPNAYVRKAAIEHDVCPNDLMSLVRIERQARGLDQEMGVKK